MAREPFQSKHQPTSFYRSVLHAWDGLIHTVVHQRNMRMHVISAILVGLVGGGIPLGLAEKVTLIFCVLLVLFAEMLNSALEQLVDLAIQQFDEKAKLTKDIAAAGVLVLAIGTVVIFAAVLVHNAQTIFENEAAILRQVLVGVPLTFLGGALMHEQKKPKWLDALFALGALGLWGVTLTWTESLVFSAMTFGLLVVCINAALWRHR
ncbi:MAG: diacylglycerol kinase [Myxococcota bacterium]